MTAHPTIESPTVVDAVDIDAFDVVEAGEVFEFVADWLTAAGAAVAADLARHLDPTSYPVSALIADCRRRAAVFGSDPSRDRR